MILVTGGLGFLGGRICQELINKGNKVRIGSSRSNIQIPNELRNCSVFKIDLHNPDSLRLACEGVDTIIHLAALNSQDSKLNPQQALLTNGMGTLNLLSAAIKCGVENFLYFSTVHVYGCLNESVIDESLLTKPTHHYSITHKLAEDYVLEANKNSNISTSVFRLSNVIGAPLNKEANCWMLVAHDLCRQVAEKGSMKIDSNKDTLRDFIGIKKISQLVADCINNDNFEKIKGEIINISSGTSISLGELAQIIKIQSEMIFNFKPKISYGTSSDGNKEFLEISNQKARAMGFDLEHNLNSEIKALLINCKKWFFS